MSLCGLQGEDGCLPVYTFECLLLQVLAIVDDDGVANKFVRRHKTPNVKYQFHATSIVKTYRFSNPPRPSVTFTQGSVSRIRGDFGFPSHPDLDQSCHQGQSSVIVGCGSTATPSMEEYFAKTRS